MRSASRYRSVIAARSPCHQQILRALDELAADADRRSDHGAACHRSSLRRASASARASARSATSQTRGESPWAGPGSANRAIEDRPYVIVFELQAVKPAALSAPAISERQFNDTRYQSRWRPSIAMVSRAPTGARRRTRGWCGAGGAWPAVRASSTFRGSGPRGPSGRRDVPPTS